MTLRKMKIENRVRFITGKASVSSNDSLQTADIAAHESLGSSGKKNQLKMKQITIGKDKINLIKKVPGKRFENVKSTP